MNMEISCNIIRDLLPLYAEDMVSEDSKSLVNAHLCECDPCVKALADIRRTEPVPVETNLEPLSNVRRMIIRRRALSVMASVFTLLTLAAFGIAYLFAPFQLTAEQAIDDFYIREDGNIVIDYSPYVTGRSMSGYNDNWFINQYSTRYDMWRGDNRKTIEELFGTDGVITEEERQRYENISIVDGRGRWLSSDGKTISNAPVPGDEGSTQLTGDAEKNWWYSDPTGLGNDTLLYDAGKEMPAKEERYQYAPIYPILFFGGILGAAVLLLLRKRIKKPWLRELAGRLAILCGSGAVSTLFVSSGRIFTSYVGVIDQYWGWMIGTNTVFLTLTVLFWRQLYLLNRQDKGE